MSRYLAGLFALLIATSALLAQNDVQRGKVKKIDVEKKTLTLTVGAKDRDFVLTDQTRVFGAEGKMGDERFAGLKAGMEVMFKAEEKDGKMILLGVRAVEQPR